MPWRMVDDTDTNTLRRRLILVLAVLTSVLAAAGTFAGVYAIIRLAHVVDEIQQSRVVLTKQSCRQRNADRKNDRSDYRTQLANLRQVPDSQLTDLGFTRAEAKAQIETKLRRAAPIDCKKLAKQVAENRTKVARPSRGGGTASLKRARRPAVHSRSERPGGGGGGAGPPRPESPSQPGPTRPRPPSGSGPPGGGVVNPPPTKKPQQGLVDKVKQTVDRVAPSDRVGQLFDPVEKVVPPLP